MLVIISGVSGSGKDTIINMLMQSNTNIKTFPSYTTRDIRSNEQNGVQYNFVSKLEFENLIKEEKLYEYSHHHENYYGTGKDILNEKLSAGYILVKDIDVIGTENLKRILTEDNIKVISIFLNIDKEEMNRRLMAREDNLSKEKIELREKRYDFEISQATKYDYIIKNLDAEKTRDIILKIIEREMSSDSRNNTK